MSKIIKHYTNGEVTVKWQPDVCIHSRICWMNLRTVFDPSQRPWINPEGASTEAIIAQVNQCPSGAISYHMNNTPEQPEITDNICIAEMAPNGPLLVRGELIVKDADGNETRKTNMTAFCRCGASTNKPYCDGTHRKIDFQG